MAVNREALDKVRKANNLPPLTDDEFASLSGNGISDAEKEAQLKLQQEEQKKKDAEKELADKNAADDAEAKRLKEIEANKPKELSDTELLELVAQKTGRKVSGWDDLKPKAEDIDKEKAKEERESKKWGWAYENNVIKRQEHENFIADSQNNKDLVYRLRLQEAKKEDPNLDEKIFEAEFDEEFGLHLDPSSRRYKNGQATINNLASQVLKNTYGSIYSLDEKYTEYEKQQMAQQEQARKIQEGAPVYKAALDKVKADLKKISVSFGEGEDHEVEMLDESIGNVIDLMSDPKWAADQILKGFTYEQLKDTAWTAVLKENFPAISKKIAEQYLLKHAAGTKGINQITPAGEQNDYVLTEQQQKLKSLIEESNQQPATAN